MRINDRLLASSAYLFGIPALYIVLTDNHKKGFVGAHGARAFLLWVLFFAVFFGVRALIDRVWETNFVPELELLEPVAVAVMAAYALFCGYRSLRGRYFGFLG